MYNRGEEDVIPFSDDKAFYTKFLDFPKSEMGKGEYPMLGGEPGSVRVYNQETSLASLEREEALFQGSLCSPLKSGGFGCKN